MGIEYIKLEPKKVTSLKARVINADQKEEPVKKASSKRTTKKKTE